MPTRTCIICGTPFVTESDRKETCKKDCRKKRKSQISHKKERTKGWVKMRSRTGDRFRHTMREAGVKGPYIVGRYLKASTRRFKIWMQTQFRDAMSWEMVGFDKKDPDGNVVQRGIVQDHIVPLNLFDLTNEEHVKVCWHYTNLRPDWHLDNLRKHSKLDLSIIPPELREKVEALGIQLTEKKKKEK